MKATGIVRRLDELGRIVIPKEIRKTMYIEESDGLEIFIEGNTVILKKYEPACVFCGEARDVIYYMGKNVCTACKANIIENN